MKKTEFGAPAATETCSETSSVNDKEINKTTFENPKQFYAAFFSLSALALAAAFSSTSLSVSLATIAQHFSLSTPKTFWLATSTALTSTVIQPCCATLADVLGRKKSLTISAAALAIGSLIGALAQNYATIISGRSIQGIGAGGVYAISDIIITDIVPLRHRGKWFAFISISAAIGTTMGPILSGVLTKEGSWRWIFAINVIMTVIAILACLWALPSTTRGRDRLSKLRKVDFIGFTILSVSLVALLVPLMQATVVFPWKDARTLVPLLIGFLGIMVFLIFEQKFAKSPLIPLADFNNRTCLLTFFCTLLHGLVLWCLMYYLPVYYEFVKGYDMLRSGLAILPETSTLVFSSALIGVLVSWSGRYRWAIWLGWAVSAMGVGILYLLDQSTPVSQWIGLNLAAGIGMGILFGALGFAIQASVEPERVPIAITMFSFFRSFGAALGIAIGSAMVSSETENSQEMLPMDLDSRMAALRKIWIFCTAVCALAFVASLGIQSFSLEKPLNTSEEQDKEANAIV
ncbi:major facilitator superfamily domain-containing protein [Lophiotrema nucula]|uniref:Major facilitator superfamily domain-containing protein n=1 Tax=Lophiotrema nucula TaxID=690887 RepID=A0A6A5Z7S8_9PLEO|nr:major facilitator superfamily domain-containing protein [Lophiotrema nucula]